MVPFATSNEDNTSELGNCKICPVWKFSSNAEQDRHRKLFHYYAKTPDVCKDRKFKYNHKVDGNICGEVFPSQHFLNQHKISKGHKRNRIEKAKQDDEDTNIKKSKVQRDFFIAKNVAEK